MSSPVLSSKINHRFSNCHDEKVESADSPLTTEQSNIITACLNGENVFFTGGAGTGKSTLLLQIIEKLNIKYGKHTVYVTATTGLAACAIGGTTVQQFAGMYFTSQCVYG